MRTMVMITKMFYNQINIVSLLSKQSMSRPRGALSCVEETEMFHRAKCNLIPFYESLYEI